MGGLVDHPIFEHARRGDLHEDFGLATTRKVCPVCADERLGMGMKISDEELSAFRQRVLDQRGDALIEIHGWLVGVMCAVERLRGRSECGDDRCVEVFAYTENLIADLRKETDWLIAALRKSEGPL